MMWCWRKRNLNYNSRTPTGCDYLGSPFDAPHLALQLTHPLWGVTTNHRPRKARVYHYNPRTPQRVRQLDLIGIRLVVAITTHAPLRSATMSAYVTGYLSNITTHTPLARCDLKKEFEVNLY